MVQVDIAIVGAGMVGAALAASLKDTGFSIALIDSQSHENISRTTKPTKVAIDVTDFEARVSALTLASRDLLADIGAWEYILPEQIMPYQKMHVWDQLGTAEIKFDAAELYQDSLGFIVENQNIVSALHNAIADQKNLSHFYARPVENISKTEPLNQDSLQNGYELLLKEGPNIQCKILVGADGAHSKVRTWAGMPMREWDYQHHAIVATVKTELQHGKVARQRFSEMGPLAFLPLNDTESSEHYCSIVWSQKVEQANKLMALSDEEFRQTLALEIENMLGNIEAVSQRFCFPLRQRHVKSYVKSGIVLIGDAAHTLHPLAGQGVNLGFKDVKAFSQMMHIADKNDFDVNHEVLLNRYQRQREGDNLLMIGAMEGFKRLFEQPDPLVRLIRNIGLNWVNKQSFVKNQIARHAMGLS